MVNALVLPPATPSLGRKRPALGTHDRCRISHAARKDAGSQEIWVYGTRGRPSGTSVALSGVWGSGPHDVWAAGGDGIIHWNGSPWSRLTTGTSVGLSGVWGSGPDDVWIVGGVEE